MMEVTDSESESENQQNAIINVANSKKWPKAEKPAKMESDDEYPTEAQQKKEADRTKTFEEMEWGDESIIDQEEILRLEFINGPLKEIQDGSRTTLENYQRFRQFFTPTKKFHQVLQQNQEMNHTIRERHKSETKRTEKLCRAEKEKRIPWQ